MISTKFYKKRVVTQFPIPKQNEIGYDERRMALCYTNDLHRAGNDISFANHIYTYSRAFEIYFLSFS